MNTATQAQLESLKGVGEATAKKIIAGRPYKSVDELATKGVPQRTVDAIKPLVTVGGAHKIAAPAAPHFAPPPPADKAGSGKALPAPGPVDINAASESDLQALPGIGPATAKAIVAGRPYASVDDLGKVKGIGPAKVAALRSQVTVGGARKPAAPTGGVAMPPPPAAKVGPGKALPAPGPVDINAASESDLQALPGIGPATAKAIVAGRPYASVDDLGKVKGIGPAKIAALRSQVTVGGARKPAAPAGGVALPPPPARPAAPGAPTATPIPIPTAAPPKSAPPFEMPAATNPTKPASPTAGVPAARPGHTGSAAPTLSPGQKVNINTASVAELEALPWIGPEKAKKIVAGRPYGKVEDVMKVSGIKQGIFSKIKDSITVD